MREIKFRGKKVDTGEWVTGSLAMIDSRSQKIGSNSGQMFICDVQHSWQKTENGLMIGYWIEVLPETVGQYIGVDTNGKDVYEGDVSKCGYIIIWNENKSLFAEHYQQRLAGEFSISSYPMDLKNVEIIGNIHDNPELLK